MPAIATILHLARPKVKNWWSTTLLDYELQCLDLLTFISVFGQHLLDIKRLFPKQKKTQIQFLKIFLKDALLPPIQVVLTRNALHPGTQGTNQRNLRRKDLCVPAVRQASQACQAKFNWIWTPWQQRMLPTDRQFCLKINQKVMPLSDPLFFVYGGSPQYPPMRIGHSFAEDLKSLTKWKT